MNNLNINFFIKNKFVILILILLASISIVYALIIANTYGTMDFQYSPTKLFKEKINPYEYFLYSEDTSRLIPVQWPVYSHATYIFFYFFSFLEWEIARFIWSVLNLSIGLISSLILSKFSKLNNYESIFLICLFCLSTPFRNCIGNGQLSFIILISYCSIFLVNRNLKNFFLGFSYMKYSFMPALAFFIFFKNGIRGLLISGLFCVFGWLIFSYHLEQSIFQTLFQPIVSGINGIDNTLTRGDLYTILNRIFNYFDINNVYLSIIIILITTFLFSKHISNLNDPLLILNLLLIVNLFTFGHLIYDYVVLLPSLFYSFKNFKQLNAKLSLIIIFYLWFGFRIIEKLKIFYFNIPLSIPSFLEIIVNFFLLLVLYWLNMNIKTKTYSNI